MVPFDVGHDLFPAGRNEFIQAGLQPLAERKVFNPQGQPIGFIELPERAANLTFGGVKRNRLFMAGSQSLYAVYVNAQGATVS